jgi:hypothetical protein
MLGKFQFPSRPLAKARAAFLLGASPGGVLFDEREQISAVDQSGGVSLARIAKAGASDSPLCEQFVNLGSGKPREINGLRDSNPDR